MFCFIGYPRGPFSGDFFKLQGMRQRAKRRKTVITTVVLGLMLFLIAGGWAYLKWPDPPMEELRNAAEAISVARDAEAAKYAPELLHETIALFDSAMVHLKTENSRFFLSRDFTRVDFFAREATIKGAQALAKASAKARSVHHTTAATLEDLENMAAEFKRVYAPLPLNKPVRESFNQAVMILSEARLAREKSDYHIAEVKLEKAGRLMRESVKKPIPCWRITFQTIQNGKSGLKRRWPPQPGRGTP